MQRIRLRLVGLVLIFIPALPAQGTLDDYTRAAKLISRDPSPVDGQVHPESIANTGPFTYLRATLDGFEFVLVDPERKVRQLLFDHARLAGSLSRAAGKTYSPGKLRIDRTELLEKE